MASIKINKGAKINISGTLNENKSSVNFKTNGNIDCYEVVEVPVFTSKASYSPEACLSYSVNKSHINWEQSHISEAKGKYWDYPGNILCLVIPSNNNKYYVSYQKVEKSNYLIPLNVYQIQSDGTPFMYMESSSKKIYCTEFIEA